MMSFFKKSKPGSNQMPEISRDANLQAMVITASHICDASIRDLDLTSGLTNKDWELIWSSLLFGGLRFMSSAESIDFTNLVIGNSNVDEKLKEVHRKVSTEPDETVFYSLKPEHQEWLNTINKQIYEIAFEEGLLKHTNVDRNYIYEQVLPFVEHYITKKANPLTDTHLAFAQIIASSISLAAEEIISQEPKYGLQATKDRYGACQVVFSLAMFLFIQRV
jgi:hypothetical protein